MRQTFLPYNQPDVGEEEIEAVAAAIRSRWLTRGPLTERFEHHLSSYLDGVRVVAVNSCTAGLYLALMAAGIGPGDEVITTPYTFAASVNVIVHVGATPVLVDIDPKTGNIDPGAVEAAIGERTRAILPVHFAGHPADLDAMNRMRDHHGLTIIEDAAHAIGARHRGRRVGTHGNLTAFSFYATKNLTTGEGGALVVPDPEMAEHVRLLSLHGMSRHAWNRYSEAGSWHYDVVAAGFKFNMTDVDAAMGLVQLRRLDAMQERRRQIAARLHQGLEGLPLTLPTVAPEAEHAWHLYPVRLHLEAIHGTRGDVVEELKTKNIGTSVHFIPIHLHSYYQNRYGWQSGQFPRAEAYYQSEISLPLYPTMSDGDVDDVVEAVRDVLLHRLR